MLFNAACEGRRGKEGVGKRVRRGRSEDGREVRKEKSRKKK